MRFLTYLLLLVLASCTTRNLVYLSDLHREGTNTEKIQNALETRIQSLDVLGIRVSTLSPESNLLFNSGVMTNVGAGMGQGGNAPQSNQGYRVDNNGEINFPILGKVKLAGLTLEEATDKMVELLETEARNPIVNITIQNFRVSVLGEVVRPGTIPVPSEKISVLEVIALAGDLTPFGKRENILLMREVGEDRVTVRLNLNEKELLNSPYFYLQQNDVLYVEPDKARSLQSNAGRVNATFFLAVVSTLSFLIWQLRR